MFGISVDTVDAFKAILLLVVTSAFVYSLLKYFNLNVCQDARLAQAGVMFLLSIMFDSPFALVLSIVELVIGIGDYIAQTNSNLAWLDPNLA